MMLVNEILVVFVEEVVKMDKTGEGLYLVEIERIDTMVLKWRNKLLLVPPLCPNI